MKSQDVYILLKLVCLQQGYLYRSYLNGELSDHYSARGLSAALGVSKTEVNASIRRSIDIGMAIKDRKSGYPKANKKALLEFVVHGLKYVFPAKPAEITRGIPTAFSAPMLEGKLLSMGEYMYVWPCAESSAKGLSVQPLFKSVPKVVIDDKRLYEYLAFVDAIRLGNPHESNLAAELFEQRLLTDG
jgi:biotin operon repressor